MKYYSCTDCGIEKTGRQLQRPRCRDCGRASQNLKMLGKTHSPETIEKCRAGKIGNTNGAGNKGRTNSLKIRKKMSIAKGGDGDLENRKYPGLKRWTRLVKERDNYCCAECNHQGIKGDGFMDAHHVIPKASHPELATVLFNGVTLCKPCHYEVHICHL